MAILNDSVFSPILAQFQDEEPIPYPDDEPILPRKEIEKALDSRETRYTNLLATVGFSSTDTWWKSVEPALEKGDKAFVEKTSWTLSPNFQQLLYGLWTDTWDLGCFHAVKGLNILNQQATDEKKAEGFSRAASLINFADVPLPDYPQDPFYTPYPQSYIAYPPNYGYPLRDTDLRAAVEQRTIFLADDVNTKTRDRIQQAVMDAVSTHGESGIPKRDRVKLLAQINLALGRQSLEEIKDPNISVGEKLVRTRIPVPGTQSFANRAKTIAATEVSAGYSLGRLQVYTQAGVKRVRWQTLEDLRVCRTCRTRNGIIFELDMLLAQHQYAYRHKADPTQYVFPAHPNCFPAGTPIRMGDGTTQTIENIKINDWVAVATTSKTQKVYNTMRNWFSGNLTRIIFEDGRHILATPDHPIWDGRNFVPAASFRVGEYAWTLAQLGRGKQGNFPGFVYNSKTINSSDSQRNRAGNDVCFQSLGLLGFTRQQKQDDYRLGDGGLPYSISPNESVIRIPEKLGHRKQGIDHLLVYRQAGSSGDTSGKNRCFPKIFNTRCNSNIALEKKDKWDIEYTSQFTFLQAPQGNSHKSIHNREEINKADSASNWKNTFVCKEQPSFLWSGVPQGFRGCEKSVDSRRWDKSGDFSKNLQRNNPSGVTQGANRKAQSQNICADESLQPHAQPKACKEDAAIFAGEKDSGETTSIDWWQTRIQDWQAPRFRRDSILFILGSKLCSNTESLGSYLGVRKTLVPVINGEQLHSRFLPPETESLHRDKRLLGTRSEREAGLIQSGISRGEICVDNREEIQNSCGTFQGLTPLRVTQVEEVPFEGWVYNFSVENDEVYLANDILVHNCRCLPVPLNENKKRDREMISDPGRSPEQRQPSNLSKGWSTLKNVMGVTLAIASATQAVRRGVEDIQRQQLQRQQQEEQQKQEEARRLARSLMVAGKAALSLGLLYMIMRNQQKTAVSSTSPVTSSQPTPTSIARPLAQQAASYLIRQEQIRQVGEQPVLPAQILTEENQQATLAKLPSGLDLRAISQEAMRGLYGLTLAESQLVNELRKQYERDRITPPEQALIPQFFLPPNLLDQYPQLRTVGNLRDLSLQDLARIVLQQRGGAITSVSPQTPQGLQANIQSQVQDVLALPPAVSAALPGQLMVGGANLNSATADEIARMLPAGMSLTRRQAAARRIYDTLRRMAALNTPITSLEELAAIPGIGRVTVRNLQSRNYTQNLNNLLLQIGDADARDAIAGILDIGPKLANEIVQEFRQNGQFGEPGVDPIEDLIERLDKRVAARSGIAFGEDAKNRIRERLSGRLYQMPIPPTQPTGLIQTQGVGQSLLPAASTPSSSLTATPSALPGGASSPQLPSSTTSPPPIITPTSSVGFPSRPQPAIQNTVIPVASREVNQQARRDTALDNYSTLSSQAQSHQSDLTEAVNAGRMPKNGLMGGGLKMDKHQAKVFDKAQTSISKAVDAVSSTEVNAVALDKILDSAEQRINEVEYRLQNIDDPLAEPLFRQDGQRTRDIERLLQDARSAVTQGLAVINDASTLSTRMQSELQQRKDELSALRSRSLEILSSVDPSQKEQLGASIDSELLRLQSLSPDQLGSYYAEVQGMIRQYQELRTSVFDPTQSAVIKSIDGQIAAIDDVLQNAQNLQRPELVEYLTQTKQRLEAVRSRINNLPRTFDELAPPQQQGFVEAKATRDRIQGTSLNLDRNLSALQRRLDKSAQFLDSNLGAYASAITPLQSPGVNSGETLHEQQRRQGIEYIQNLINLSTQGIETELQTLKTLVDPVSGISSVLASVKQTQVLQDLPALPYTQTPGLAVPGGVQPEETIQGRLLDEAVKRRRTSINQSAARITSSATLQSGFPYSYVQRIQAVLDPSTPNSIPHPEAVTRSRLAAVTELLEQLSTTRERTYIEIQELANAIAADLEQLRSVDPVAYQLILKSPTWTRIRQLRANAASQVSQYDTRITALQSAAAQLNDELSQPIRYNYRGAQLTAEQIRDRLNQVKQEVAGLIKKRRDDLSPIWNKAAPLTTVDSVGLEKAYRKERPPTQGEQDFIASLTPAEQKTLGEAAISGALSLFRRKLNLVNEKQRLTAFKNQLWGDPTNPERLRGKQVPKTILKGLEVFNKTLKKQLGMKIVLVERPELMRIDWRVVDLVDVSASNYEPEPGFKDYKLRGGRLENHERITRKQKLYNYLEQFEALPWVADNFTPKEDFGLLDPSRPATTHINWPEYIEKVENQKPVTRSPTNYVEAITALELIQSRITQIDNEMEVIGFQRKESAISQFNRKMSGLKLIGRSRP